MGATRTHMEIRQGQDAESMWLIANLLDTLEVAVLQEGSGGE